MYAWRGGFSFLCTILLSSVEKFMLSLWRNSSIIGRACAIQFKKKNFFFSKRVVVRWNMHTCNQRQIAINISLQFLAIHCLGFCSKRGFSILLFFYQNVYYTIYLNCQSFFKWQTCTELSIFTIYIIILYTQNNLTNSSPAALPSSSFRLTYDLAKSTVA